MDWETFARESLIEVLLIAAGVYGVYAGVLRSDWLLAGVAFALVCTSGILAHIRYQNMASEP